MIPPRISCKCVVSLSWITSNTMYCCTDLSFGFSSRGGVVVVARLVLSAVGRGPWAVAVCGLCLVPFLPQANTAPLILRAASDNKP